MRTIRTKIYNFDELTEEAKAKAIQEIRNEYQEYNDFSEWVIDDCYLLEPKHDELIKLFGENFYTVLNKANEYKDSPLIKNTRELYFSLDRDKYIDISKAMEIQNNEFFLQWLGIDFDVDFLIKSDSIVFDKDMTIEFSDEQQNILGQAKNKFSRHCEEILKNIESNIEYRFTDEAIKEDISSNEFEFLSDGKKYN